VSISSIIALKQDSEIIVVDFCPLEGRQRLRDALSGFPVKVITVKSELADLLLEDRPKDSKIRFYEHLAKHIGISKASGDKLIICNPDNIFPSVNFDEVLKDIDRNMIVRAYRLEIPQENVELDAPSLISKAERGDFEVTHRFNTAAGDFTALKKDIYYKIADMLLFTEIGIVIIYC